MVDICGLDPLGAVHASLGLLAVTLGLAVVAMRKGTAAHRRAGLLYAIVMVLLNATALMIYDLFGGFGPFHVLALVSLATVSAGVVPVWLRRPRGWLDLHARFMSWSYAGLVAALFSEIGARVPGVGFTTGVVVPTAAVMLVAALLIHRRIPGLIARIAVAALIVAGGTGRAAEHGVVATVTVELSGFRNATGLTRVALVDARQFLKSDGHGQSAPIQNGRAIVVFQQVPPGRYAIQAYHDENGNRKLDTGLFGVPKEPYGFSNDARNLLGRPKFDDAAFMLTGDGLTVSITVQ
jgi:uncharacterized protein (DUF2141 family)/uncharacterized membrane protein